jgi:hypothetical protein
MNITDENIRKEYNQEEELLTASATAQLIRKKKMKCKICQ